MGLYVNPDNNDFQIILNGQIYVDKSLMISELNKAIMTPDRFLCVSRPRRFGKTMAESMLAAYYSVGCDSSRLFSDLKISGDPLYGKHLNKYNVLRIDMNRFWSGYGSEALSRMACAVRSEFEEEFPGVGFDGCDISECIIKAFKTTKTGFVVLIDEYDVVFRDDDASCLLDEYLKFLNVLFKSADVSSCIALAYITGILPVIRDKAQSKLNNFKEITFLDPGRFASFSGFTQDEVRDLCEAYGMDFLECRSWYDGYKIKGQEIYAPRSVACAMQDGEYKPYWSQTSQYEAILDYIRYDMQGIREDIEIMISGGSVAVNTTLFLNNPSSIRCKDDVFTYLCHLGYLSYDERTRTCFIPNREVRGEWLNAITINGEHEAILGMIRESELLVRSVWQMDAQKVAGSLERTHERLTSPLTYNNEDSFQSAIRLAFFYADCFYTIVSEYPSGKGYADLAFIPYKPNIPAMLVELKVKGTAATALDQIRDRRYFAGLEKYEGSLLLVGISYDPETKKHECLIEKA